MVTQRGGKDAGRVSGRLPVGIFVGGLPGICYLGFSHAGGATPAGFTCLGDNSVHLLAPARCLTYHDGLQGDDV